MWVISMIRLNKATLPISGLMALTGCYWSQIPLLVNYDIFNSKGRVVQATPMEWRNFEWSPLSEIRTFKLRPSGDLFDYVGELKGNESKPVAMEKINGGFVAIQYGELGKNLKNSAFSYGVGFLLGNDLFIWRFDTGGGNVNLNTGRSVNLFDECYRKVYKKSPKDPFGSETKYNFSFSLKSDLNSCIEYIRENRISPNQRFRTKVIP